jgi:hypothetical protein
MTGNFTEFVANAGWFATFLYEEMWFLRIFSEKLQKSAH